MPDLRIHRISYLKKIEIQVNFYFNNSKISIIQFNLLCWGQKHLANSPFEEKKRKSFLHDI